MRMLKQLIEKYHDQNFAELGYTLLKNFSMQLIKVPMEEISSTEEAEQFIFLLRKFREAVASFDELHGEDYPATLKSLLSVGEDGLYSNQLRFIYELIQNVDDCDYQSSEDCKLDMAFDYNNNEIILTYNEKGFTPQNVFYITGIAGKGKNVSADKQEIGEKGIGFKSVFGIADKVLIESGWFSFVLHKDSFTIPVVHHNKQGFTQGTRMTLYVRQKVKGIYDELKAQYSKENALFAQNPILFLNKLTSFRLIYDAGRSMEFKVSRSEMKDIFQIEKDVEISMQIHDFENGKVFNYQKSVLCARYSYTAQYDLRACQSRYGEDTAVARIVGKPMTLRAIVPYPEYIQSLDSGSLYSFLPTQQKLTVPIALHVPFKLSASRESVDSQSENKWFTDSCRYLQSLLEQMYRNWCTVVREDIIYYLPAARLNLFARGNGVDNCLSRRNAFMGEQFLKLPIFYTVDDESFHNADEIFCFGEEEKLNDPLCLFELMGYSKHLFISPVGVKKHNIYIEREAKDKLLLEAFRNPNIMEKGLILLDEEKYDYSRLQLNESFSSYLNPDQVLIAFKHEGLRKRLQKIGLKFVKENKRMGIIIIKADQTELKDAFGEDIDLSTAPKLVQKYMSHFKGKCTCLDVDEDFYLPCFNILILSSRNALSSFVSFCSAIDPKDLFSSRIRFKDASNKLNKYVDNSEDTTDEFMRKLCNIRINIKDILGKQGYDNYIRLILKTSANTDRYIQELLQNADDCIYNPDVLPSFEMVEDGNKIFLEYNEDGFTRSNVRAITAIGESTKKILTEGTTDKIGEKGIGFKSIFAIASEVRIQSNDFSFLLKSEEPTIPRAWKAINPFKKGTRMEIILKNGGTLNRITEGNVLDLCLCLRKLKSLKIGSYSIEIKDTDSKRIITINGKEYIYERYIHRFVVNDKRAMLERCEGGRSISQEQSIMCLIPEHENITDCMLYCGLPTKHRMNIPLIIDAPFALTTSREEIDTGSPIWNKIVRYEVYQTILEIIEKKKTVEREDVFRFIKIDSKKEGTTTKYYNNISDSSYMCKYNILEELSGKKIIPTYDSGIFQEPRNCSAKRYPAVANYIFKELQSRNNLDIAPSEIVDVVNHGLLIKALNIEHVTFNKVYPLLSRFVSMFITSNIFRTLLYKYLLIYKNVTDFQHYVRNLSIIPVYGKSTNKTMFIKWQKDNIYVKEDTFVSPDNYYVLNTTLLPKALYENIFGNSLNEITEEWEHNFYNDNLKKKLKSENMISLYYYLISEYRSGQLKKHNTIESINFTMYKVPLKNELSEISTRKLYYCDIKDTYFPVSLFQEIIAAAECEDFAVYIGCSRLSKIHYEDLNYHRELTADDIESILYSGFDNQEELLRGFYKAGKISERLLSQYNLTYLGYNRPGDYEEYYEFPGESIGNMMSLKEHINKLMLNPLKYVDVEETSIVKKIQNRRGDIFDPDSKEHRQSTMKIYTPLGIYKKCFCQMCKKIKAYDFIEVNNLEVLPEYYFPQLRIALCLECSKTFIALRSNENIRNNYLKTILVTPVNSLETMQIEIYGGYTITFTAKHFAEIREILRRKNSLKWGT